MLAYLAGLIDAEGNVRPYPNPRTIGIVVSIWNTDTDLLGFAYKGLKQLGYRPLRPYLHKRPGGVSSGFKIRRKKAEWRVLVARFDEVQSLLRRLPLRHREKVAMKEVALSVDKGDLYERVSERVSSLKKSFKEETIRYTEQAELEYLRTHATKSPPVLCTLQKEAWKHTHEEIHEKIVNALSGCLAAHEEFLCWGDEPCVVICKGCSLENIVSVLVHESIHHALFWLGDEFLEDDTFDKICDLMSERGFEI